MAVLLSSNSVEEGSGKDKEPVRLGSVFFRKRVRRIRNITSSVGCNTLSFRLAVRAIHPSFSVIRGKFDSVKFRVSQEDTVILTYE